MLNELLCEKVHTKSIFTIFYALSIYNYLKRGVHQRNFSMPEKQNKISASSCNMPFISPKNVRNCPQECVLGFFWHMWKEYIVKLRIFTIGKHNSTLKFCFVQDKINDCVFESRKRLKQREKNV